MLSIVGLVLLSSFSAWADLQVAALFGDGMVLQRDQPIRVFGTASPGQSVHVQVADRKGDAAADGQGKWIATLDALSAGGPIQIQISGGGKTVSLKDVLIGDI